MLDTFLANLRYAVRNKQTITVGGGDFSPGELKQVLQEIETAKAFHQAVVNECFKIEGCLNSADPVGTIKCLIETNINYNK